MTKVNQKALILAHRGNGSGQPENTLLAFQNSLQLGAAGVELDVWRCKSGEFVVQHDPKVNALGSVENATISELESADESSVLLLADVLQELPPCVMNIEVKTAGIGASNNSNLRLIGDLGELVEGFSQKFVFVFSTFDRDLAAHFDLLGDNGSTALLIGIRSALPDAILFCSEFGIDSIHLHWRRLTSKTGEKLKQSNLDFSLWTVNSPKAIEANLNVGARFLITDNVSSAVEISRKATIIQR